MNEVARAVEREFDEFGKTVTEEGDLYWFAQVDPKIAAEFRTLQRLLKKATKVINRARDVVARDSDSQFWRELDAFLAELPEGYGEEKS